MDTRYIKLTKSSWHLRSHLLPLTLQALALPELNESVGSDK